MTDQTNQTQTNENTQEAPQAPKTRREKLVEKYNDLFAKRKDIDAKLAEIVAEVTVIDKLGSIGQGSTVVITVGKKDEAQEVQGIVIGVKTEEDGKRLFKVQYGTGFDADVAVVAEGKIKLPAEAAATEEAATE